MTHRARLRLGLDLVVLCIFAYAAFEAGSFSQRARYMPLYVSVVGAVLTALLLAVDYRSSRRGHDPVVEDSGGEAYDTGAAPPAAAAVTRRLKSAAYYLAWMLGYVSLIALAGLPVASALFVAAFLHFEARVSLVAVAWSTGVLVAAVLLITNVMNLRWPPSLLGWFGW